MEELETIRVTEANKKYCLFGLWPWQFERYRKIKVNNEYKAIYFEPWQHDFYVAEAEIELLQPKISQRVTLRGIALKRSPEGKIKLIIATNMPADKYSLEALVFSYLNRWPEPEKSFSDFSHKIELFTYTASSHKVFSTENLAKEIKEPLDIKLAWDYYLNGLDLFLRGHILPSEYQELDFSTTKQRFYQLKARIRAKKDYQWVSFTLPGDYAFSPHLLYACQRLNEKDLILPEGKRLWLTVS